jgi:hypothetical protein
MVSILLCQNLGSTFAASHCDIALAIHVAVLDELLAGLLVERRGGTSRLGVSLETHA